MGDLLLERRFPARSDELAGVRDAVRALADGLDLADECAGDVVLAIDEAAQNIIRHAYHGEDGVIVLRIERSGAELRISLEDFATCVDPDVLEPQQRAALDVGGLGTHLIQKVMDEVELRPTGRSRGNLLRMVKRIP